MLFSKLLRLSLVASVGLTVLVGCGTPAGPSQTRLPKSRVVPAPSAPLVAPAVNPSDAATYGFLNQRGASEGAQLLAIQRRVRQSVRSFEAVIRSYTQGYYKGGERTTELHHNSSEIKVQWSSPKKLRLDILQTNQPLAEGAKLVTHDLVTCRLRAKGLLGLFPVSLAATDPKLANNRNHLLPDLNPVAMVDRLSAPGAVWNVVSEAVVDGTRLKVVQVSGVKPLDAEVTREVVAIDPVNSALRRLTIYSGETKVGDFVLRNFRWNPRLSSGVFEL